MNLFLDYQKKIFKNLKSLEKKKIIQIPQKIKSINVELPPKNQKADISCNAAMILAKDNNSSPDKLAEVLKKHLLLNFKEFKSIEIAKPGFAISILLNSLKFNNKCFFKTSANMFAEILLYLAKTIAALQDI